jgi:hypothetical protein
MKVKQGAGDDDDGMSVYPSVLDVCACAPSPIDTCRYARVCLNVCKIRAVYDDVPLPLHRTKKSDVCVPQHILSINIHTHPNLPSSHTSYTTRAIPRSLPQRLVPLQTNAHRHRHLYASENQFRPRYRGASATSLWSYPCLCFL